MYKLTRGLNRKEKEAKDRAIALLAFRRHFIFDACMRTLPETDFRGKIEPPVEKGVLKIERYAQRLTQGYSADGGSYLWAPVYGLLMETYSSSNAVAQNPEERVQMNIKHS